jgi:hypothetical protein
MRTTVDLPDELLRAVKTRAAQRGERLRDLFTRALAHEVGLPLGRREGARVELPLIGSDHDPKVDVTNADIEAALSAEDAEKYDGR